MDNPTPETQPYVSTQSASIKNLATALCLALPEIPEIDKKRHARIRSTKGEGSSYEYSYADLSDILAACTKPLAKNGLCVVWSTTPAEKGSILSGILLHAGSGEWMKSSLAMPAIANPQEMGSMLAYLKRYIFGLLVPVAATEADDDGQGAAKGLDDDETSQAALLDAKRKEREAKIEQAKDKAKKEGRFHKVSPAMEEKTAVAEPVKEEAKLAAAGLAPVEPAKVEPRPEVQNYPKHVNDLIMMLGEDDIPIEKFMTWATSPRVKEGKGRLLPEGTKIENLAADWVLAITAPSKWLKIIAQLK